VYDFLIAPFVDYLFMRRALVASIGIAMGCGPVGVLLILRRLSLIGDALSHGILPGIAIAYLVAGLSLFALTIGGIIAGLLVILISGYISRRTNLTEEASFTGFYIISLALGVLILSLKGGNLNLTHLLFGSVLAVDGQSLQFIALVTTLTILTLALVYRPLVYECFDPIFVQTVGMKGQTYHFLFLGLVVVNLVAACQSLGTLMALGIMMLPSIAARLIARQVWTMILTSVLIAILSGYGGLLLSYHLDLPSGPVIILVAGAFYFGVLISKKFQTRS
jgi:zinc/manganese transport system permease protein